MVKSIGYSLIEFSTHEKVRKILLATEGYFRD
jgi:hypothetical protein